MLVWNLQESRWKVYLKKSYLADILKNDWKYLLIFSLKLKCELRGKIKQ